jgi:predicted aspartyl protease
MVKTAALLCAGLTTSRAPTISMGAMQKLIIIFILIAGALTPIAHGSVALSALDQYLVAHGYAGAQFIQFQNTYRLPISANGKVGDLTIDTGAPSSIIYTKSLNKFGLTYKDSGVAVHGVFGKGSENFGITSIPTLTMGNCTLLNVKAAVVSAPGGGGIYQNYGASDGLFGLREMVRYGAVLDLANHLLLVHPGGPAKEVSPGIRSLLTRQGYTAVDLEIAAGHLKVAAVVNGAPCRLLVDTGCVPHHAGSAVRADSTHRRLQFRLICAWFWNKGATRSSESFPRIENRWFHDQKCQRRDQRPRP